MSADATAVTLVRACLARIAEREPLVEAWAHLAGTSALAEAQRLDAAPAHGRGVLHGVPIGVKDVLLTRDMPTGYGSPLYGGFAPGIDAAAVAMLRCAGAILLGKTHTVEFAAIGAKPPTRNPANPAHTPGGSSSGSAAAVADGHVPLALGTQTGGSIIRPASFCGAWALKPSWGLVDRDGAKAFAPSLDTIGWFGRSADDLALLLAVFAPDLPGVPTLAPDALRIAVCRTPMWHAAEPAMRDALAHAERALVAAGAAVTPLDLPAPFAGMARDHETIMFGEGATTFRALAREHGEALHPALRTMAADPPDRVALRRAYDAAAAARPLFDRLAADFDAVIAPSAPGEAPFGIASTGSYVFNGMWTLLHTACVNIPALRGPTGLPVGLTATGPRFGDAKLVGAARTIGAVLSGQASRS